MALALHLGNFLVPSCHQESTWAHCEMCKQLPHSTPEQERLSHTADTLPPMLGPRATVDTCDPDGPSTQELSPPGSGMQENRLSSLQRGRTAPWQGSACWKGHPGVVWKRETPNSIPPATMEDSERSPLGSQETGRLMSAGPCHPQHVPSPRLTACIGSPTGSSSGKEELGAPH